MLSNKTAVQGLLLWLVILASTLATQLWIHNNSETEPVISPSQINLVKNAALPIFLSENRSAAVRQLESLIQETDIREIRIYGADQSQIASVINSKFPASSNQTLVDRFPVTFQGSLAGSVQMEVNAPNNTEANWIQWLAAIGNSILIASIVLILASGTILIKRFRQTSFNSLDSQPDILAPRDKTSGEVSGSSLLLFIFPVVDTALKDNQAALDEALASLYRRLETLVQAYGGRVLSLSQNQFVCRMPSGQSSNDNLQALIFTWGIAKPLVFRFAGHQYRIEVKTLLHKTSVAARQGTLYPAIAEIDDSLQNQIKSADTNSHISREMKDSLDKNIEMEFTPVGSKYSPRFWNIAQVKPSLAMLWRKQESALAVK